MGDDVSVGLAVRAGDHGGVVCAAGSWGWVGGDDGGRLAVGVCGGDI